MVVSPPPPALDPAFVRAQFPSLDGDWTFMDNAGGSQIAQPVLDRLQEYLVTSNVQLGASYEVSQLATERLAAAQQVAATLVNAARPEEVVIGPSTSMLLRILAHCWGQTLAAGDEVIVTNCDHEANITPWLELERAGITVKVWPLNAENLQLELADLESLLTPRTRLVALTHASNVLGEIVPIAAIAERVHRQGALLCVDGVGYAPHRLVDVQALDVDFYVFSLYKVYGPHIALLYGKYDLLRALPSFNHRFIGPEVVPYKLQPGGANYELSYSLVGLGDYLSAVATHHHPELATASLRQQMAAAFDLMAHHEQQLCHRLLDGLMARPGVRIIGPTTAAAAVRVPTVAFTVEGMASSALPPQVDPHRIGIRYGHFYAQRLIEHLGLTKVDGVVRVSLVHYNTLAECDRLLAVLGQIW